MMAGLSLSSMMVVHYYQQFCLLYYHCLWDSDDNADVCNYANSIDLIETKTIGTILCFLYVVVYNIIEGEASNDGEGLVQKGFDSRITDSEFSSNCEFHDSGIVM